mmetsp:Transcript_18210/g.22303  ORF Transcript_18210/g.22303 Transcript_18210/m.22303 type:complete len:364 (-) Transcript_18210:183-1274(-)
MSRYISALSISIAASTAIATTLLLKYAKKKEVEIRKFKELREAERKGRIKAEILLRTTIKNAEEKRIAASSAFYSKQNTEEESNTANHDFLLRCIGEVVSPFTKRMGTPRQGALAPHARGYIQLNHTVAPIETLSGIENYSHAWVLFCFHANTDCQSLSLKTKVRPPRAKGIKVGCMATRSPHRPNPIGLSLVKLLSLDEKKKRLYIAAIDLVNGTPVYDIKPVVPWDIPGHFDGNVISVPDWVSQEDAMSAISFSAEAEADLEKLVLAKWLSPLYTEDESGCNQAKEAIKEILAQDPRAVKRRGKVDNRSEPYKIYFGSVQLEFVAIEEGNVDVVKISPITLTDAMYVDGIPLSIDGTVSLE